MATLKLALDLRRVKHDNKYPLVFRISLDGNSRIIPTGFSLRESEWNPKTESVNKSCVGYTVMNMRLNELKGEYIKRSVEFDRNFPGNNNVQRLKQFLTQKQEKKVIPTVYDFWLQEIKFLHKANRNGGAKVYHESLKALHRIKDLRIPFEVIDYAFLKNLEGMLISSGNKINTVGIHFRTLRAIYNKAINSKLVGYDHYPFRSYRIRRQSTTPKVLTLDEMRAYFNLRLSADSYLYESWLLGKLMFMLIGVNFKDMILMKEEQIHNGRFLYNRSKTGTSYSIKLHPHAIEILDYFRKKGCYTIIGRVKEADIVDRERLPLILSSKNGLYNDHLKTIGKMLGYKERLRGYVFRYTWANLAKQIGYTKDLIAEALGHQYGNPVTGIYLEGYDLELIDSMNEQICDRIKD